MALTPAEKQRRYRERHKDRPTPAQEIRALKARVAELEGLLRQKSEMDEIHIKAIDSSVIDQWERALGRKGGRR